MTRLFPSRDDQVPSCYLYCLSSTSKQQTSSTIVFRRRRTFFHILEMQDPFILSTGASSCNLVIFDKSSHLSSKYSFFPSFFLEASLVSTRLEFALMRMPLFTGQHVFQGPRRPTYSGDFHFRGKHKAQLSIQPTSFFHYSYKN